MARRFIVAKRTWEAYQFNLRRARALIKAQGYLQSLWDKPDKAIETYYESAMSSVFQLIGFDMKSFMNSMNRAMKSQVAEELERQFGNKDPAAVERHFKEQTEKAGAIEQALRPLLEPIINLQFLKEQTLAESGVVMAVGAYEAFLRDLIEAEARRRPSLIEKFPAVEQDLDFKALRLHGHKAEEAGAALLARRLKTHDFKDVRKYLRRAFEVENPFPNERVKRDMGTAIHVRHLIVHNGGVVTREFQHVANWKQAKGTRIELKAEASLRWVGSFYSFGRELMNRSGRRWAKRLPVELPLSDEFGKVGAKKKGEGTDEGEE